MGLKLQTDSIVDVLILETIIREYMNKKGINLLQLTEYDESQIQIKYDKMMNGVMRELRKQ